MKGRKNLERGFNDGEKENEKMTRMLVDRKCSCKKKIITKTEKTCLSPLSRL